MNVALQPSKQMTKGDNSVQWIFLSHVNHRMLRTAELNWIMLKDNIILCIFGKENKEKIV